MGEFRRFWPWYMILTSASVLKLISLFQNVCRWNWQYFSIIVIEFLGCQPKHYNITSKCYDVPRKNVRTCRRNDTQNTVLFAWVGCTRKGRRKSERDVTWRRMENEIESDPRVMLLFFLSAFSLERETNGDNKLYRL